MIIWFDPYPPDAHLWRCDARTNLTLIWTCANIQPTRRPLFYAQKAPFYTPVRNVLQRSYQRHTRTQPFLNWETWGRVYGAMGTNQE